MSPVRTGAARVRTGTWARGRRAQRGPKRADRAPSVEAGTRGAATVSRLRFGAPAAPEGGRLRLLPSGPDLVHGSSSPRDRTIDIAHRALTPGPVPLGRGFSPARADCGYRAPLAPRLARSTQDRSAPSARKSELRPRCCDCRSPSAGHARRPLSCSRTTRDRFGGSTRHESRGYWARIRRVAAGGRVRRGRRRGRRARRRSAQGLRGRRRRVLHRGHLVRAAAGGAAQDPGHLSLRRPGPGRRGHHLRPDAADRQPRARSRSARRRRRSRWRRCSSPVS